MNDLQKAIFRLVSSPHYQKLATYKPPFDPFDPFDVMGVLYREHNHSKVLGWLLNDEANREFRKEFVSWIVDRLDNYNLSVEIDERVEIILEYGDENAGRIDVFAHFPGLELAVAIEVKVWAGEQDNQIQRYQDFLKRKYANCRKVVIFLTPLREHPETSVRDIHVPVLNMSWDKVARIIDNMQPEDSDESRFRIQFRNHLDRRIAMKETKKQRIVKDLLREGDNAKTIQRIIYNMPSLEDFSKQWRKIVAEVCGVEADSLKIETYRSLGLAKELKITVPEWCKAGLPFTLMLYKYEEDYRAGVRILLQKEAFDEHRENLMKFAESNKGIVDDKFPPVDDWRGCRAVLADDGSEMYPDRTAMKTKVFYHDKKWKKQVKKRLESQMEKLREPINNWLNNNKLENQ